MNIVIVTSEEFPYGAAATNRVLTYMPGIVGLGHSVTILCTILNRKENVEILDSEEKCKYQGITIRCMRNNYEANHKFAFFKKNILRLHGRIKPILYLYKNRKTIDIVQMYSTDIEMYFKYGKWCKRFGLKYTIERSEMPDIVKNKELLASTPKGKEYIRRSEKAFGLFDGWILETRILADYYSKFFAPSTKIAIVPMTVDVERFVTPQKTTSAYGNYIAYCGNMGELDGVSILIKAYSIFRHQFPSVKLVLIGYSDSVPAQQQLVESLGVKEDVIFTGRVSRDEVPQLLKNASALALASPTSLRASVSMPCKVGEYLCTGNPVVVTGLGEINRYLKDGESAFLSAPDSAEAFAQKLEEVFADYDRALTIGSKGREVSLDSFGSDIQVKRIESFYREVLNN